MVDFDEDSDYEEEEQDETQERIENGEICAMCEKEFLESQGDAALCKECWNKTPLLRRQGMLEADCDTI